MAAMEAVKSTLRRIIYVTIFCFAIYGIISIGILVDKSRKRTSVSLTAALILLAILLAFLVIFTVIICLWRRANQNIKSRQRGRDEEELYTTSPGGRRYIRTDTELRAIKKKEKYERGQKDRQRSIWGRIHHAGDRISGRQISYLWDAKNERGNPIGGPPTLDTHPARKPATPPIPMQEPLLPLFGQGSGTGIIGGRTAVGAQMNINHSLLPPASPGSPSRVPRTDGRTTCPEMMYNRPDNSEYTAEEFEAWEKQRHEGQQERQGRKNDAATQTGQVRKNYHLAETEHELGEEGSSASNNAERAQENRPSATPQRDEKNGQEKENGVEVENSAPSRNQVPWSELGTPPRHDRGILGAKLHDGNEAVLARRSALTIGYCGEKIFMGSGRLPSALNGHGLIVVPPQVHHSKLAHRSETVGSHSGHESWRQASGFYANRADGVLSMVSEERSDVSRDSDGSKKSWNDMTADEVERERNKRRAGNQKHKGKEKYKAYAKGGETSKLRPLVVRNKTPTPPLPIKKDLPKRPVPEVKESCTDFSNKQDVMIDLGRFPSGIGRKGLQKQDISEEERWLHRTSSFHFNNQRTENPQTEGRKRSNTSPYEHLSVLPDGLHILPKQPALKKTKSLKSDLNIGTLLCEKGNTDVVVLQEAQSWADQTKLLNTDTTAYKAYVANAAAQTAKYQAQEIEEKAEHETEWQRQKRINEWNERTETELTGRDRMKALQPIGTIDLAWPAPQSRLPSSTVVPQSFAEWEGKYQRNARARGVSGFTSASASTTVSAFPSYEEMKQARKEKAAEEERRKFRQFMDDSGIFRSSKIERITDSIFPTDAEELKRIGAMVNQLEHQKHSTSMTLATFEEETADMAKPLTALDSLPSQIGLAEARLAQENQEWARKNHEAAGKLEVRSLHTTERGTTFSSIQGKSSVTVVNTPAKSGIPRLAGGAAQISSPGTVATSERRHKPSAGTFGYQIGRRAISDTKKRVAQKQGLGSASKKANIDRVGGPQ